MAKAKWKEVVINSGLQVRPELPIPAISGSRKKEKWTQVLPVSLRKALG